MHVELHIGSGEAYGGTAAILVVEMVGNGILDPVRHKFGVVEFRTVYRRIDGESGVGGHELLPVEFPHIVIQFIGGVGCEFHDRLQNTQSGSEAEIGTVHEFLVALEGHHSCSEFHILGSKCNKLIAENILQALKCFGHHLEFSFHLLVVIDCAAGRGNAAWYNWFLG